jgi:hypothetical protein
MDATDDLLENSFFPVVVRLKIMIELILEATIVSCVFSTRLAHKFGNDMSSITN